MPLPVLRGQEQDQGPGRGWSRARWPPLRPANRRRTGCWQPPGLPRRRSAPAHPRRAARPTVRPRPVAVSCSAVSTRSAASRSGSGTVASRTTDRCAVQPAHGPARSASASYRGRSPIVSQSRGYGAALRHPRAHGPEDLGARAAVPAVVGRPVRGRRHVRTAPDIEVDRTGFAAADEHTRRVRVRVAEVHRPPVPVHQHTALSRVPAGRPAGSRLRLPHPRGCRHQEGPNNQRGWTPAPATQRCWRVEPRLPSPAERARLHEGRAGVTQARLAAALKRPRTVKNRENGRSEPKSPDQPGGWAGRGRPGQRGGPAGGMRAESQGPSLHSGSPDSSRTILAGEQPPRLSDTRPAGGCWCRPGAVRCSRTGGPTWWRPPSSRCRAAWSSVANWSYGTPRPTGCPSRRRSAGPPLAAAPPPVWSAGGRPTSSPSTSCSSTGKSCCGRANPVRVRMSGAH